MIARGICEVCRKAPATQIHHLLPQTKVYKKLYGDMIHHPKNLMRVCEDCHMTKPIPHYTERQFCDILEITPRSKTEKARDLHGETARIYTKFKDKSLAENVVLAVQGKKRCLKEG